MYVCMPDQKRASDLIPDGCEEPWGWWELNSRPMEEQPVYLTAEKSLLPTPQTCTSKHPTALSTGILAGCVPFLHTGAAVKLSSHWGRWEVGRSC